MAGKTTLIDVLFASHGVILKKDSTCDTRMLWERHGVKTMNSFCVECDRWLLKCDDVFKCEDCGKYVCSKCDHIPSHILIPIDSKIFGGM